MHRARAAALAGFIAVHAVEPDPKRCRAVRIAVGQGSGNASRVPLFAGDGTSLAADASVEIDDEPKLLW